MAEAQQMIGNPQQELFDAAVMQQAEKVIAELEESGMKFPDREVKKLWVMDKIKKNFSTGNILQTLKANNYNFDAAGRYLDNLYNTQQKTEQAIKEVTAMKESIAKEKSQQKKASQFNWIISAFAMAGVGLFMALFLQGQTKDLESAGGGAEMGMATGMMDTIIKLGWIVAIAGAFVGFFLVVLTASNYFKEKAKKTAPKGNVAEQMTAIEAELQKAQEVQQPQSPKAQQPTMAPPKMP